jgi:hypothetical protein
MFKVFILFHIFLFIINAVYLQTAAGILVVVRMPQCEKPRSTINIYFLLKLKYIKFVFNISLSLHTEKRTKKSIIHIYLN